MPKELTPLEQLQLLIPGYRGYKIKDLIRQDDFLIRQSTIAKLQNTINNLSTIESQIASSNPFSPILKRIESIISEIRTLIGMIQSSQGGGADIYARYKIQTEQLDEIVKNDLQMISIADQVYNLSLSLDNLEGIIPLLGQIRQVIISRQKLFFPAEYR
ncbi:hypothetical protein [Sulfolobus acidocaldarius]|uniref:Conserved protein n=4 Tax=Sulfolobus acidocaldarius TaxID=2285 RepID=Q4J825_SULAC|nr:hypothetical protein [Sulfolobus acidocaldarius]AAY81056.1 conserved protein [Sulfolobus acidocaldarius DSM 639]AGE71662.1 hypothetical protein SacN8_08510 [Sulfolobus acidocaldarius N8]AGE73936.1 hypothetical protein SacRon12I_08525 [Sulfolobus acidocaldarius Ron12/I]ALU30123.1 hypothetical protein ATY89_09380 [Sulfolobus acidocaldarius]ALU30817.1 hypothetical protein ATZ20_00790 [Sulfolobus acidocaldarius]